ncbi:MAG: class I SAM-dependent methyltransferase [Acidimicrobiia bacterium]
MGERRSRTAQGVAAERSLLAELGVLADPFSRRMLSPSWSAFVALVLHWPFRPRPWSLARAGLAGRVLWHDAEVTRALDAGVRQLAVIGAGYDSRAWRLRRDGVRFFELDHPATQEDKIRRAPGPGPTYVSADLTSDSAAHALVAHGLDPSQPTHFVLEGLTMYLGEAVARHQLRALAEMTAPGSSLAVDFHPPNDAGTARDRRLALLQRLARTGSGETLRLLVERPRAVELVEASGWQVREATSLREVATAAVSLESELPVELVSTHKTVLSARRP